MSKSARKSTRVTTKHTSTKQATHALPWIIDDINYGPALAAIHDLTTWAFDIAANDVADWPAATRRVRNARRFAESRIRGQRARAAPLDDVLFTAALLARIFDAELSLGAPDMIAILDQLGLPSDAVPMTRGMGIPRDHAPVRRRRSPAVPHTRHVDGGARVGFRHAA